MSARRGFCRAVRASRALLTRVPRSPRARRRALLPKADVAAPWGPPPAHIIYDIGIPPLVQTGSVGVSWRVQCWDVGRRDTREPFQWCWCVGSRIAAKLT